MDTAVVIVGRGIAGLVLAGLLRRQAVECIVLDRPMAKPYFPLAETLPPSAMPLLHQLGLMEVFEACTLRRTYGYHSMWGSSTVVDHNFFSRIASKHGLKLDKLALVERLETWAQAPAIDISQDRLQSICIHDSGVTVTLEGENRTIQGKLVVDATGRSRTVLRTLGIATRHRDTLIALSCHLPKIKHPRLTHDVYVESFENGWGIVSGLDLDTNVMSLFTHKRNLDQTRLTHFENWPIELANTVILKDFLTQGHDVQIHGGNANSSTPEAAADRGWLAVGDAALAFDPLSSHGIANAVYTAQLAANTIVSSIGNDALGAVVDYSETISAIFEAYWVGRNRLYRRECRWATAPFWSDQFRVVE